MQTNNQHTELRRLRPLGALERYMVMRSQLGIYNNVAVTARFRNPQTANSSNLKCALFRALSCVVLKHPVLSAIPVETDTEPLYFAQLSQIDLDQAVEFVEPRSMRNSDGQQGGFDIDRFLQDRHNHPFRYTTPPVPFWKIYIIENPEHTTYFTMSFFFHHCIADTKSALVFLQDIETSLNNPDDTALSTTLKIPEMTLLPPLDDLLPNNGSTYSKPYQENQAVNHWTGNPQSFPATTRFRSYLFSRCTTTQLIDAAKLNTVSLTATLTTMLVASLSTLVPSNCTTFTTDCAISLRPWLPSSIDTSSSIGCFIDNISLPIRGGPFSWTQTRITQAHIDRTLREKQWDNLCGKIARVPDLHEWFSQKIGRVRDTAIEVSNVGRLSPAAEAEAEVVADDNDIVRNGKFEIGDVLFSQAAGACSAAVKVSAVTGRGGRLWVGFSWQEGIVGDEVVDGLVRVFGGIVDDVLRE